MKLLVLTFALTTSHAFAMHSEDAQKLTLAQTHGDKKTLSALARKYELKHLAENLTNHSTLAKTTNNKPVHASPIRAAIIPELNCIPDDVAQIIFDYADCKSLLSPSPFHVTKGNVCYKFDDKAYSAEYVTGLKKYLVASGKNAYLLNLNPDNKKEEIAKLTHLDTVNHACYVARYNQIMTACDDGNARLWDLASNNKHKVAVTFNHGAPVNKAKYIAQLDLFSTTGTDGFLRLWTCDTKNNTQQIAAFNHDGSAATSADYIDKYKLFLTGSYDGTARLLKLNKKKQLQEVAQFKHPARYPTSMRQDPHFFLNWVFQALYISEIDQYLTVSADCTARLWELKDGNPYETARFQHNDWVCHAVYKGNNFIFSTNDGWLHVWELDTERGKNEVVFKEPKKIACFKHDEIVQTVEYLPETNQFITASHDKTVRLWDAKAFWPKLTPDQVSVLLLLDQKHRKGEKVKLTDEQLKVLDGFNESLSTHLKDSYGITNPCTLLLKKVRSKLPSLRTTIGLGVLALGYFLHNQFKG